MQNNRPLFSVLIANHNDGSFVTDGADIVPLMIKACTNTDDSYWFDAIWTHSPEPEK